LTSSTEAKAFKNGCLQCEMAMVVALLLPVVTLGGVLRWLTATVTPSEVNY
jgi:hypothetical protein